MKVQVNYICVHPQPSAKNPDPKNLLPTAPPRHTKPINHYPSHSQSHSHAVFVKREEMEKLLYTMHHNQIQVKLLLVQERSNLKTHHHGTIKTSRSSSCAAMTARSSRTPTTTTRGELDLRKELYVLVQTHHDVLLLVLM